MPTCPRCRRTFADDFTWCPYDAEQLDGGAAQPPHVPRPRASPESASLAVLHDRFEVHGLIGQGGMASVFHAVERSAGVEVAIKVMNHITARTSPERQRFLREAEMMLPIRHSNIMHVFASGQLADGSPYIVMQYLDGETLGTVFRRADAIDRAQALRIASDAAAGLAAAHAEGIVHRDVKPDNIFLVGSPTKVRMVKVLDFGLARLYGASGLTARGMIVGTPEYMAPEQTVNDATDARTDIYALGVVLYRLLTGVLPFQGREAELLAAHLALPPPPLATHGIDVPARVERVVMGALRKLPRNRYPSMQDFREDLLRLAAEDDAVGPTSVWQDAYVPQSAFAQSIARVLWKKAGVAPLV
jgi:serine/threonine protein kinase